MAFDATVKKWFRDPTFWMAEALSAPGEVDLIRETVHALQTGAFQWQSFIGAVAVFPVVVWLKGHMTLRETALVQAASVEMYGVSSEVADLRGHVGDVENALRDRIHGLGDAISAAQVAIAAPAAPTPTQS